MTSGWFAQKWCARYQSHTKNKGITSINGVQDLRTRLGLQALDRVCFEVLEIPFTSCIPHVCSKIIISDANVTGEKT